jgi:predicted Co/Zn/Cd cation transporter (cation efflux family)
VISTVIELKMITDSNKFSGKIRWPEDFFNFAAKKFSYLFWFLSPLTIAVFAYLYSLVLTMLLWMISRLVSVGENQIEAMTKMAVILCFILAFGTQLYLWKMWKGKKAQKGRPSRDKALENPTGKSWSGP